jgi:hypothetical protein
MEKPSNAQYHKADGRTKQLPHLSKIMLYLWRGRKVVGPIHQAVTFQLFQRQTEHPRRDAEVPYQFIEPQQWTVGEI